MTEAGFGADLGAEKFFDIKCRKAGLKPAAAVMVATVRALKMHGGVALDTLGAENLSALKLGLANLARHIGNIHKFGVPVVVAINRFNADTEAELDFISRAVGDRFGLKVVVCDHWARGGAGAEDLARAAAEIADSGNVPVSAALSRRPEPVGQDARDRPGDLRRRRSRRRRRDAGEIRRPRRRGLRRSADLRRQDPVLVLRRSDPLLGAPTGFTVTVKDVRLRAGAGFVVALMGDIRTMPGLPRSPAAERIRVEGGEIEGLF